MKMRFGLILLLYLVAVYACDPVPVQYPPGSAQYPYPNSITSQPAAVPQPPEITGSQRWQHAWGKAMEGVVMGGSIAGPYGAGGGLVIGLITGLISADSHYGQINNQIQTEQQKDQQLEAAIEQELARQRSLETQIANASAPAAASEVKEQPASAKNQAQVPSAGGPAAPQWNQANVTLASLPKPSTPQPAPSPFKNVEIRDVNGDGVPDLWIYYNPKIPDEIIRQEESTRGDGRVDTWSYFKDGMMVRREVDNQQLGRPDTVYFYDNDKLVREERDETGQGSMTYRALYQNGRIAKVEKDSTGAGRPDLWTYYDTSADGEFVLKEERDLSGDGIPDLWSYFENGRLVRRDVNAVGLEILSKKDQLPAPASELSQAKMPGE
jgi:hypothetical protein